VTAAAAGSGREAPQDLVTIRTSAPVALVHEAFDEIKVYTSAASGGSFARGSLRSAGAQAMSAPSTTIVIRGSSEEEPEQALQVSGQAAASESVEQSSDFLRYHSTRRSNRHQSSRTRGKHPDGDSSA